MLTLDKTRIKTASELGIDDGTRKALIWVRDGLRKGFFKKIDEYRAPNSCNSFNMGLTHKVYECGSVACIGGWTWVGMHLDEVVQQSDLFKMTDRQAAEADEYVYNADSIDAEGENDGRLHRLFFPSSRYNYNSITEEQAALAIENFLETGDAKWDDVMSE